MKLSLVRIHQRPDPAPHLKWLLNERAMLLGEVQRRESRIRWLTTEAPDLNGRIAALDSAMALFDSRVVDVNYLDRSGRALQCPSNVCSMAILYEKLVAIASNDPGFEFSILKWAGS